MNNYKLKDDIILPIFNTTNILFQKDVQQIDSSYSSLLSILCWNLLQIYK